MPEIPSALAVMIAAPFATAVTTPLDDTVAVPDDDEVQVVAVVGVIAFPAPSLNATVSACVAPSDVMLAEPGDTVTDVSTGAGAAGSPQDNATVARSTIDVIGRMGNRKREGAVRTERPG